MHEKRVEHEGRAAERPSGYHGGMLPPAVRSLVACGLLGLAACKMSNEEMLKKTVALREEHAAQVEAVCVPAVTAAVLQAPPLAEDRVTGVTGPLNDENAVILDETMAKVLLDRSGRSVPKPPASRIRAGKYDVFSTSKEFQSLCSWVMSRSSPNEGPTPSGFDSDMLGHELPRDEQVKQVADALARFDKIRYVVVVRTLDYAPPSNDGGRLRAGHVKAEALVLDSKGAGHGGFRFEARSSGSVKYTQIVDSSGRVQSDESFSAVLRDLADNAKQELKKALVAQVPGSDVHVP